MNEQANKQAIKVGQMVIDIDDKEKQLLSHMGVLRQMVRDLRLFADCVDPDNGDSSLVRSGQEWKMSHPDIDSRSDSRVTGMTIPDEALDIVSKINDLQFQIENAKSGLRSELSFRYGADMSKLENQVQAAEANLQPELNCCD